ncbi:hypothetical protein CYMTET_46664 [Cymbomonas tetramitiformis]|uniref:Uncharacterized protein n=1 Tax=Cymbomonas tetramitiformis TaxID=36881 RepID=A0AAE0BVQ5_9CHLO|nr:hypothetical protein CYMTET_46664 [Cymbomonas tetramitiformis]
MPAPLPRRKLRQGFADIERRSSLQKLNSKFSSISKVASNSRHGQSLRLVTEDVLQRLRNVLQIRSSYHNLTSYLFVFFFCVSVVYLQLTISLSSEVTSALYRGVVPPKYSVTFLEWLKTQILEIWEDPICGDGVCHEPYEVASFGRFGCQVDCGKALVVPVILLVEINVVEIAKYLPLYLVDDLRQRVLWNVCWMEYGLEEMCWFEKDRGFNQNHERQVHSMDLKSGQWYIRVRNDYFRSVSGEVIDATNYSHLVTLHTQPSWEPCPDLPAPPPPPPYPPTPWSTPLPPLVSRSPTMAPTSSRSLLSTSPEQPRLPSSLSPWVRMRHQRVAGLLSPVYAENNWGDSTHCRQVCEATVNCMAFAYHLNHSWCFFKSCFDLATITWEASTDSEYEFHYFGRDSCIKADGEDAATNTTTRRRALQQPATNTGTFVCANSEGSDCACTGEVFYGRKLLQILLLRDSSNHTSVQFTDSFSDHLHAHQSTNILSNYQTSHRISH